MHYGGGGNDTMWGGAFGSFADTSNNVLVGGIGNDSMNGGAAIDSMYGDDGLDTLNGGAGIDDLVGGADKLEGEEDGDGLYGGDGDDFMMGENGNDTLIGQAGADVFKFTGAWGNDAIQDFQLGVDRIDMSEAGVTSFSQLSFFNASGSTLVFSSTQPSNQIYILGIAPSALSAANFGL